MSAERDAESAAGGPLATAEPSSNGSVAGRSLPLQPIVRLLLERCTFPPAGTAVTCAVSGGADSTALLVLSVAAGCVVDVVHVDHGLRPTSGADAAIVVELARRFAVPCRVERVTVGHGPNLEARARAARRRVLPPGVLTGHTLDDQAETVVINLMRGAGLDGLGAMSPEGHPLLGLRRSETQQLCRALGLVPAHDETNDDVALLRNRVRHEVLPMLDAASRRDLAPVLARQAALLRDEASVLDELSDAIDPTDADALAASPVALARRAIRRWLSSVGDATVGDEARPDRHPPDAASIERVLSVARGEIVACELAGGRRIARTGRRLRVE